MFLDLLAFECIELECEMKLENTISIGVFNQLLFLLYRQGVEQLLVIHVEVNILLLELLNILLEEVGSDFICL